MTRDVLTITQNTVSFGDYVVQTSNITTLSVEQDSERDNLLSWLFFGGAALAGGGVYGLWNSFETEYSILAVALGVASVALWRWLGPKYSLIMSTSARELTAISSSNLDFIDRVKALIEKSMNNMLGSNVYTVNVDQRKIVSGNEVNVSNSSGATVAGGDLSSG